MAIKSQKKGNQELNMHAFSREGFSNKNDGAAQLSDILKENCKRCQDPGFF